jgi:hypothetical protein
MASWPWVSRPGEGDSPSMLVFMMKLSLRSSSRYRKVIHKYR